MSQQQESQSFFSRPAPPKHKDNHIVAAAKQVRGKLLPPPVSAKKQFTGTSTGR